MARWIEMSQEKNACESSTTIFPLYPHCRALAGRCGQRARRCLADPPGYGDVVRFMMLFTSVDELLANLSMAAGTITALNGLDLPDLHSVLYYLYITYPWHSTQRHTLLARPLALSPTRPPPFYCYAAVAAKYSHLTKQYPQGSNRPEPAHYHGHVPRPACKVQSLGSSDRETTLACKGQGGAVPAFYTGTYRFARRGLQLICGRHENRAPQRNPGDC